MNQNHEESAVDLDASSSLELDRRMAVQEYADPSKEADLGRPAVGRHHCATERREILQQPFQDPQPGSRAPVAG